MVDSTVSAWYYPINWGIPALQLVWGLRQHPSNWWGFGGKTYVVKKSVVELSNFLRDRDLRDSFREVDFDKPNTLAHQFNAN